MSKVVGVFVCILIMTLDVIAGILGIKAEAAQNQVLPYSCDLIFDL